MIGQTLSHFKILDRLGEGGMGEVYLAEDLELKRKVALKILPEELASDNERLQRFRREAEALAALDHPNIVTVHSIEESDGVHFFTMQHVEGVDLSERIPSGGMPLEEFFEIAVPLSDALAAAHDRGVTHRDLKPANVMVGTDGRVRVLDFGLAKLTRDDPDGVDSQVGTEMLTGEGRILGTVAYMSPEQAQGKPLDTRSDIFSLGVVLHEMATGRRPFAGDNQIAVLSSIVKDTPPSVTDVEPDLPRQLGRIIKHTLEKDPGRRFQSARDLRNEICELEREVALSGTATSTPRISSRATKPPPVRRILAAAAIIVSFLVVGRYLVPGPNEDATVATTTIRDRSIAVLPFENLSPDPENEYFSYGMTEELVSKLSRIGSFRVRSTPLGWSRGEGQRIEEIGRDLGVRFLLEGSVRKAGDQVRITAHLIDGESAVHLWSEDFDGELEDVFAVQEDTALEIAEALDVELSIAETEALRDRYTENAEAYDAYLRGWALIESFHIDRGDAGQRIEAAKSHFDRALALDPDYPLALAGLAAVESYTYYLDVDRSPERVDRAEQLARRALEIDPGLPEALVSLGQVAWYREDNVASADFLREALKRDPDNGYAWCELASACNNQDPPEAVMAEEAARNAIHFQPGYTWAHAQLGLALEHLGRHSEALDAFQHSVELSSTFRFGFLGLGDCHLALGNYAEAIAAYESAQELGDSELLRADIAAARAALEANR